MGEWAEFAKENEEQKMMDEYYRKYKFNQHGMSLKDFIGEYEHCQVNNLLEGKDCANCKGEEREFCAEELVHRGKYVILTVLDKPVGGEGLL